MKQAFSELIFSNRSALINTNTKEYMEFKPFSNKTISIRNACTGDIDQIYDILLSSDDYFMNTQEIEKALSNLIVLTNGNKLLAVLYFECLRSSSKIKWIAIHPMYPEKSISLALRFLVCSI